MNWSNWFIEVHGVACKVGKVFLLACVLMVVVGAVIGGLNYSYHIALAVIVGCLLGYLAWKLFLEVFHIIRCFIHRWTLYGTGYRMIDNGDQLFEEYSPLGPSGNSLR